MIPRSGTSRARSYRFRAEVWKYKSKGAWYFVTLPKELSAKIRAEFHFFEEGWGRLKCEALVGEATWETAIWFDTKADAYLLPVKKSVRKISGLEAGDSAEFCIRCAGGTSR